MKRIKNLTSGSLDHLLAIFCIFHALFLFSLIMQVIFGGVRDHLQKAFGQNYLHIYDRSLESPNDVELNGIWIGEKI